MQETVCEWPRAIRNSAAPMRRQETNSSTYSTINKVAAAAGTINTPQEDCLYNFEFMMRFHKHNY